MTGFLSWKLLRPCLQGTRTFLPSQREFEMTAPPLHLAGGKMKPREGETASRATQPEWNKV